MKSVNSLLHHIRNLRNVYELIAKNSAENFNIFSILGMEAAEVKTHSKFIAELLNPNGSHGQDSKFLNLFLKYIFEKNNIDSMKEFDSEKCAVKIEHSIGKVTETAGGRVDISIKDLKNRIILIENKIYAIDQKDQLLRYENYGNSHAEFAVLYLTLEGKESPTGNNYHKITYKEDIIKWLEQCKKEVADFPIIRESLTQYIYLLKKLTNQTTNNKMKENLQDNILRQIEDAKLIRDNFDIAVLSFCRDIQDLMIERIKPTLDYDSWEIASLDRVDINKADCAGQLYIKPQNYVKDDWRIGIEGFNPLRKGNPFFGTHLTFGVWGKDGQRDYYNSFLELGKRGEVAGWWNDFIFLEYEGTKVSLINSEIINKLMSDKMGFIDFAAKKFTEYFELHKRPFEEMIFRLE